MAHVSEQRSEGKSWNLSPTLLECVENQKKDICNKIQTKRFGLLFLALLKCLT